ncbi:MAG: diphosphomevalonate decarboxylase [Prolixibacteraceae bacterium]|jgi:diphosphomevalonate decarboxylase|nr:diphosphomevalonate decarboxylase [Prolixibacteraceae bacterium]
MMTDNQHNTIKWQSPSNIALIKYWGKHGQQLPQNASLSMTLKNAYSETSLRYRHSPDDMEVQYFFDGERHQSFEEKVIVYLERLKNEMPFLSDYSLRFESRNSFPHSTGIASSASSMSAVALCLLSMEEEINDRKLNPVEFYERASHIARLGSGSAARSVIGSWSTWGLIEGYKHSSDLFASGLPFQVHESLSVLGDAILVVSAEPKKVSSSLGHNLMSIHPYATARYRQAAINMQALLVSMQVGDFDTFACVVENEALSLHALLMTSSADGLLLKPGSLQIIEAIKQFRAETRTKLCFTIDAGPNIHLLYAYNEREKVLQFIQNELLQFCENGEWIDDETGSGPLQF